MNRTSITDTDRYRKIIKLALDDELVFNIFKKAGFRYNLEGFRKPSKL